MSSEDFAILALQICTLLAFGLIFGQIMRRIHQPAVLGEMLAGIVLGPTIAAALFPDWHAWLFPATGPVALARDGAIKLGMLFFMFIIGLEIDLTSLRRFGLQAVFIGAFGSLIPLVAGIALVYALPNAFGITDDTNRFVYSVFIGCCLANTANPVLARILLDLKLMKERIGAIVMSATTIDDLISWSIVGVGLGYFKPGGNVNQLAIGGHLAVIAISMICLVLAGCWLALPGLRLVRRHLPWPTGYVGVIIILTLLAAVFAEAVGLHAFLGPFLIGIALASSAEERKDAYNVIHEFVLSFFVPIYFVSMGLNCNFISNFHSILVLIILVTACVSKIASCTFAAWFSGMDGMTSLAIGSGMNARGAIGVILAQIGYENRIINGPTYVALVFMAIVTSLMAGPMMQYFLRRRKESLTEAVPMAKIAVTTKIAATN